MAVLLDLSSVLPPREGGLGDSQPPSEYQLGQAELFSARSDLFWGQKCRMATERHIDVFVRFVVEDERLAVEASRHGQGRDFHIILPTIVLDGDGVGSLGKSHRSLTASAALRGVEPLGHRFSQPESEMRADDLSARLLIIVRINQQPHDVEAVGPIGF